eukprot:Gb_36658 [translate_table: standard]
MASMTKSISGVTTESSQAEEMCMNASGLKAIKTIPLSRRFYASLIASKSLFTRAIATPVKPPTTSQMKRNKVEIIKEHSDYLHYPLNEELQKEAPNIDGEKIMSTEPPDVVEAHNDNSHGTNFEKSPKPIYGAQFLPYENDEPQGFDIYVGGGIEKFKLVVEQYYGKKLEPFKELLKWEFKSHLGWNDQGDGEGKDGSIQIKCNRVCCNLSRDCEEGGIWTFEEEEKEDHDEL